MARIWRAPLPSPQQAAAIAVRRKNGAFEVCLIRRKGSSNIALDPCRGFDPFVIGVAIVAFVFFDICRPTCRR
jgi:hypothetical protein